jgi:hypothetical protein
MDEGGAHPEVSVDLTSEDWVAFYKRVILRQHVRLRILVFAVVILLMPLFVCGGFYFTDPYTRAFFYDWLRPLMGAMYVLAGVYLMTIWQAPRVAARSMQGHPGQHGRRRYFVEPDAFRIENEFFETRIRWVGVTAVEEEGDHIIVHTGPQLGYVVPRRAFADEAARARFVDAARDYLRRVKGSASSR